MILRHLRAWALALALAPLLVLPAVAQQLPDGAYRTDGVRVPTQFMAVLGYDSVTHQPCVVGATTTCSLQASGGGGGSLSAYYHTSPQATVDGTSYPLELGFGRALKICLVDTSGNCTDPSAVTPVSMTTLPAFTSTPTFNNGMAATGGCTPFATVVSAASTNPTLIVAGAHTLCSLEIQNPGAVGSTVGYVRMYDLGTSPTCSSSTGAGASRAAIGSGGMIAHLPPVGIAYANGIALCITGGPTTTDNTSAPAGILVNGSYK